MKIIIDELKIIIDELDFLKETIINHWHTSEKKSVISFAKKLMKKISDPSNSREYYQSYLNKKKKKNQWNDQK